jgi:hypothetical protein
MQSHRIMFGLSLLVCFVNFSNALRISPLPRKGPKQLAGLVTHASPSRLAFLALPAEPTMPDHTAAKPESDQDEYRRKLAEAQVAIAAAEEARRRLHPAPPSRPPRATRAKLSKTDAGTLIIELPPTGLNSGTIFSGAFSIAWFSVVLPATFSGVWLFMLPFWAAGALVAKLAVVDPFVTSKLTIGQYAWSLKSIYGGQNGITLNEKEGATDDLRLARPELIAVVNGMPQYDIKLCDSTGPTSLPMGTQVSEEELDILWMRLITT